MAPGFFDNLRDHSEIKLRILRQFLVPWATKLGSWAQKSNRIIWYVDGFAGKGRYGDGSEGSPLLGLLRAEQIQLEGRGYQLACYFTEKRRRNWNALEKETEYYKDIGIRVHNDHGEFSERIAEIEGVTRQSPILLFVDPFGLPLNYAQFRMLVRRPWPVDLILTFQHRAVYRLAKDYPHRISEAIGSDAWRDPWNQVPDPQLQIQCVLDVFREILRNDGKFKDVLSYPIRPRIKASPNYYLLFASRSYDAFELWNDQLVQEEIALTLRDYGRLGQASFLPQFDGEFNATNLLNEVRTLAHAQQRFTRREIVMHFIRNRWRQYHTKDVKKAVASLLVSEEVSREFAPGKGIDDDFMRIR